MIIGFVSPARGGKDTAAAVLTGDYNFTRVGFADALKEMALAIDPVILMPSEPGMALEPVARLSEVIEWEGWERAKDRYPEVRRFLQQLGTRAREYIHSEVWIDAWQKSLPTETTTLSTLQSASAIRVTETYANIVTPDVRFLNEAARIKHLGGYIVRIVRDGSGLTGSAALHPSEVEQSQIVADFTITNNGSMHDLAVSVDEAYTLFRRMSIGSVAA